MRLAWVIRCVAVVCAIDAALITPTPCAAQAPTEVVDGAGDARTLPFDGGASPKDAPRLDLLHYRIGSWIPDIPTDSLFRGQWSASPSDFFRLDLVFDGLVNPPGLGFPANINFFGDNPLLGFLELDVDAAVTSGGELIGPQFRYYGAATRFGGLPLASRYTGRVAHDTCPGFNDADISTGPYFPERSGEEFNLAFLWGSITSLDVGSNGDYTFEPGEAWVVRGPFLNRAQGFSDFILVCCSNGLPGYNPEVDLLFSHAVDTDQTTVSLVYPLNQSGSTALAAGVTESPDCCADNQNNILEGLEHVALSAQLASGADRGDVNFPIIADWEFQIPSDYLDPETWEINAIWVSVFDDPASQTAELAWSDITPNVLVHDYNGDGVVNLTDQVLFDAFLVSADGGSCDADGTTNGVYTIGDFGNGFDMHDANYDGVVDAADRPLSPAAIYDADNDGDIDLYDFAIVQLCTGNTSSPTLPAICHDLDSNGDGDVTLEESAPFGDAMNGPNGNLLLMVPEVQP